MAETQQAKRLASLEELVDNLLRLKNQAYAEAREGYLPTLLWSLATDITTIGSVRWERHGINENFIMKSYRYIAPNALALIPRCRELHETMNILFPNTPDRYTARYIVMKFIITMDYNVETLLSDLMKLKYEVDKNG